MTRSDVAQVGQPATTLPSRAVPRASTRPRPDSGFGGLVAAQALDGIGTARFVGWTEVRAWRPGSGELWAHLDRKGPQSQHWLEQESGLEDVVISALLADDTRPSVIPLSHGLLINLRGVNLNPGAEPEDMVWVQMWLEVGRVITSRHRHVAAVEDVRHTLADPNLRGPRNAGDVVVRLADKLLDRLGPVIEELEDQMADIDQRSAAGDHKQTRVELRDVRRRTMRLRRWVGPQRDVIARLAADQSPLFDEGQRLRLRSETDRVTRYVEDLDDLHERASAVHDVISQQLSEDMNRTMYLLSVVAAIVLPLALLTELVSLDLPGIPGTELNGVLYVALLISIAAALTILFWRTRGRSL